MTKVAFLYFDDIHHIFHSVTIARELAKLAENVEVVLLASNTNNKELLEKVAATYEGNNLTVKQLQPPLSYSLIYRFHRKFPRKSQMLKKHRQYLSTFDAIVGTELSTGKLRRYLKEKTPKLILTKHGAGDRSYGYRTDIKNYDSILVSGEKIRQRLEEPGILETCQYAVTGYAKFDYDISHYSQISDIFPETSDRPTILYNPHFTTHSSSWAVMGAAILDFFCASDKYNLIFAPHIMLFDPRFGNTVKDKWKNHKHVHIDTGSIASTDMSYTNLAEIYIGDVSSQVYEFIIKPRYCIFLNAHGFKWQDDKNFLNWTVGDVLSPGQNLSSSLAELLENHKTRQGFFSAKQAKLINHTFASNKTESASKRSAAAILKWCSHEDS